MEDTVIPKDDRVVLKDKWCIHGEWKDAVCLCDPGKATFFNDKILTQNYCDFDEKEVALLKISYPPRHYLYLGSMTLTVLLTVATFMILATAIATIVRKILIKRRIREAQQELVDFEDGRVLRDGSADLNVTFWQPPSTFLCINQQNSGKGNWNAAAKVVAAYNPQNNGELTLKPGMTVTNIEELDRGWCKGTVGEKTGFFPAAFVEMLS